MAGNFVTIAGTDYDVLTSGASASDETGGELVRTFAGTLRSAIRWRKRSWTFQLRMPDADLATLDAAVSLGQSVSCGGAALGGTVTCKVALTAKGYQRDGVSFLRIVDATLREV